MIYTSKREKKLASVLSVLILLLAAGCMVMSRTGILYPIVWDFGAVTFLVVAVQLLQRYVLSGYQYILDPLDGDGLNRLTVVRVQGQRKTSVYTVPLGELVRAEPFTKWRKHQAAYGNFTVRMDFCPDLHPKQSYLLVFEANDIREALRLQCGKEFADQLEARMGL